MATIVRTGITSEYVAPESVPAFTRRDARAISALNLGDDARYLSSATSMDAVEVANAIAAQLDQVDASAHHARIATMTQDRDATLTPPRVEVFADSISTNGPNTQPASASPAVGLLLAA